METKYQKSSGKHFSEEKNSDIMVNLKKFLKNTKKVLLNMELSVK